MRILNDPLVQQEAGYGGPVLLRTDGRAQFVPRRLFVKKNSEFCLWDSHRGLDVVHKWTHKTFHIFKLNKDRTKQKTFDMNPKQSSVCASAVCSHWTRTETRNFVWVFLHEGASGSGASRRVHAAFTPHHIFTADDWKSVNISLKSWNHLSILLTFLTFMKISIVVKQLEQKYKGTTNKYSRNVQIRAN